MTDDRLRIGIIGCGSVARRLHITTWPSVPATVVALADPDEANLTAAGFESGVPADSRHRDAMELIERDDVDVIDLCTPQHLRLELIQAAVARGKHVFCEKPLASTVADADAAVRAADEAGVVFGVAHPYLWLPEVALARELIAAGELGEVRSVFVNYLGVVPEPAAGGTWRRNLTSAGGGVLTDMLHAVYQAEALLGAPFQRVSASVDRHDAASVEEAAYCRFDTDTATALVNVAWGLGPGGFEITGTHGRISVRYTDGSTPPWAPVERFLVVRPDGVTDRTDECRAPGHIEHFPSLRVGFLHNFRDYAESVRAGRTPHVSGRDGLRTLQAVQAAYSSARTGRRVELPLPDPDPVDTAHRAPAPAPQAAAL